MEKQIKRNLIKNTVVQAAVQTQAAVIVLAAIVNPLKASNRPIKTLKKLILKNHNQIKRVTFNS